MNWLIVASGYAAILAVLWQYVKVMRASAIFRVLTLSAFILPVLFTELTDRKFQYHYFAALIPLYSVLVAYGIDINLQSSGKGRSYVKWLVYISLFVINANGIVHSWNNFQGKEDKNNLKTRSAIVSEYLAKHGGQLHYGVLNYDSRFFDDWVIARDILGIDPKVSFKGRPCNMVIEPIAIKDSFIPVSPGSSYLDCPSFK